VVRWGGVFFRASTPTLVLLVGIKHLSTFWAFLEPIDGGGPQPREGDSGRVVKRGYMGYQE